MESEEDVKILAMTDIFEPSRMPSIATEEEEAESNLKGFRVNVDCDFQPANLRFTL